MRPKERRDSGQNDLFRARLNQIVDLGHPLTKLAATVDWRFLEERFGAVYTDKPGQPPADAADGGPVDPLSTHTTCPTRTLCARFLENPYYQLFCGEEFFRHKLPFDRSSLTRWRQRMGEEKLVALIQESLATATRTGAAKPSDFAKVIVDTTVQPKAVAFPTDAKLTHRAHERVGQAGEEDGRGLAPILSASGQARPDRPPALRPRQAVQARGPGAAQRADLSRPGVPRRCPQD